MKHKSLAAALLALVLVLVFGNVTLAQSKTLYWQRFDADITVQLNGDIRVVETQELVFTSGTFQYGQEDIPTDRLSGISNVQVSEANGQTYTETGTDTGQPYTYSVSDSGSMLSIRYNFPPSSDSRRTIVIAYTVSGTLRYYPQNNADQLYWAVIRPDNPFPIQGSTITLHVPQGATFTNYTVYGSPATANFQPGQRDATMTVPGPVQPGTEVDAVGEWQPHGLVAGSAQPWQAQLDASAAQQAQQQQFQAQWGPVLNLDLGGLGVLFALGGPLLLYLWWYRKGRDAPVGLIADYLPEPPSDLPPGVAGTLVDESADLQDILATILDLARRGAMEIEETEEPGFLGIGGHKDFVYRRKANNLQLLKYEQMLLDDMFGHRDEVKLSDLKNKFYADIPALRKELYAESVREGLFPESPEATRSRFSCLGIVALIVAGVVGFMLLGALSQLASTAICPGLGLGVTAIGLLILGRYMPRKTEKGSDASARWLAFKRYLQNLEKYTNVQEKANIFERYLPYAVAFGLEQEWIRKFSAVQAPAPTWWIPYGVPGPGWYGPRRVGGGPIVGGGRPGGSAAPMPTEGQGAPSLNDMSRGLGSSLAGMSAGLGAMLNSAGSVLTSQPAPQSSGRGWGGGGFSGGGFSGGGGFGGGASGGGGGGSHFG